MRLIRSPSSATSCSVQVRQRRPHRAGRATDGGQARLDDRDGVARRPVADVEVGDHELVEPTVDLGPVVGAHGVEELDRPAGHEVEERRGVGADAQLQQRQGERLRRRQAADVGEPVADPGVRAGHLLDVADPVLEADQRGVAVGERGDRLVPEDGVRAAVDDHTELGGGADLADVLDESGLAGLREVRRHQQQAVGARGLGGLGLRDRVEGAAGGGREHRHRAGDLGDGGPDDAVGLLQRQREALAGPARREEAGDRVLGEPREVRAIGSLVDLQVGREVGDREREQPGLELGSEVGRAVDGHAASFGSWRSVASR